MPDKENFNAVLEPKTYGLDRASYNQGKNAQYDFSVEEEKIGAQVAKGPGAVATSVVRRLMPVECEVFRAWQARQSERRKKLYQRNAQNDLLNNFKADSIRKTRRRHR